MKKINFRTFAFFTDITRENTVKQDVARELADLIYKNGNGVLAHDVALRIYESKGDVELTDEEVAYLEGFMRGLTPAFQDSFRANLRDKDND